MIETQPLGLEDVDMYVVFPPLCFVTFRALLKPPGPQFLHLADGSYVVSLFHKALVVSK